MWVCWGVTVLGGDCVGGRGTVLGGGGCVGVTV